MMKPLSKPFALLAVFTALYSIFSLLLMSDFGQFLGLPKAGILFYYKHAWFLGGLNLALLLIMWYLHLKRGVGPKWFMILASLGVFACVFAANSLNRFLFPTKQHTANYVSVAEADDLLEDDQVIYVLDINGVVKGYPQDHLELPHVAGAVFGEEKVAMTYCGLSNLPVAIQQDIGSGKSDFSVMAQVHNNLILKDNESGELVQQITATTEFSQKELTVYPNTMMSWDSFKELYPQAEVFLYSFDRPLDPLFKWFFAETLKIQDDRDKGAAFPTVDLNDKRLNPKERVWGYTSGTRQIAFTKSFAQENPLYKFEMNQEPLVLVYDEDHDIITLFSRMKGGVEFEGSTVDFRGQTDSGRLQQKPLHNAIYWMVWSHWFPETELNGVTTQ